MALLPLQILDVEHKILEEIFPAHVLEGPVMSATHKEVTHSHEHKSKMDIDKSARLSTRVQNGTTATCGMA
eukprot:1160717-Pelagomonas_calceolata.AAC.9